MCSKRIIGPYFFEADGKITTVTGERYRVMISDFLISELEQNDMLHYWFQQDGATCHTAKETIISLKHLFPNRLISKGGDYDWPSRSPDLSPPDFFYGDI